eukprot:5303065-Pyramimonas_sp.AAC.1
MDLEVSVEGKANLTRVAAMWDTRAKRGENATLDIDTHGGAPRGTRPESHRASQHPRGNQEARARACSHF